MQPPITIGSETVQPGTRETVVIPISFFYNHAPTSLVAHVAHGRQPGPCMLIVSTLHGDELNGVEIIRRLRNLKLIKQLKGTLIMIPVLNVFGFVDQSRYLPDRRDLNRSFPGSAKGSMAARLAHLLMTEILPHCTHVIDLHTGAVGRENLPQIRATLDSPAISEMAKAFNTPVILDANLREGTFRKATHEKGIMTLVYEAGEALRFDEVSIRAGAAGILNVLHHLGMISRRARRKAQPPLIAKGSSWVRAPQSGVVRMLVPLGAHVAAGETLAYVGDPFGESEEAIVSPAAGIVIGRSRIPLVHEGEAIFHIARYKQASEVADSIEQFQDFFDPESGTTESEEPPLI
jgi:predicted deacylase